MIERLKNNVSPFLESDGVDLNTANICLKNFPDSELKIYLTDFRENEKLMMEKAKNKDCVCSDVEGPLVSGDSFNKLMSTFVTPNKNSDIDYGGIIYNNIYEWYTYRYQSSNPWYQEASDIRFSLPLLMAFDVTQNDIDQQAKDFLEINGAMEYVKHLKNNDYAVFGITSGARDSFLPANSKFQLDGLFGSEFPIDQSRQFLKDQGVFESEMEITNKFLENCFKLIDGKAETKEMFDLMDKYYIDELGFTFDSSEQIKKAETNNHKTKISQILETINMTGDIRKAIIAKKIFDKAGTNKVKISQGDGLNDITMNQLDESTTSFGLNCPEAALGSKIGVITKDMSNLIPLVDLVSRNKDLKTYDMLLLSQSLTVVSSGEMIVHLGGVKIVSDDLLNLHRSTKKYMKRTGVSSII